MADRRALIIAPDFPPCSLVGVHRSRFLSTYLGRFGWEPIVLTVQPEMYESALDYRLEDLVPKSVRVERVSGLPVRLTRPLGLGDVSLRSWVTLRARAVRLIQRLRPRVIFASVLPTYHTLIAAQLARRYKLPFVLDYQDPWVSSEGADHRPLSKAGLVHRLAKYLEPRVLRWTSHVTAVSDGTWEGIRRRHPQLRREHFTTLPIGGDPNDFAAIHQDETPTGRRDNMLTIAYVGTIWPQVNATLRAFLAAIQQLRVSAPNLCAALRVLFVGTQAGSSDPVRPQVKPLADALGVGEFVTEHPQRVPYLDALLTMSRADVLLVLGSDLPHYTASKLFPYLISGKPVLAVVHEDSEVTGFARASAGVKLVTFSVATPVETRVHEIADGIRALATDPINAVGKADLRAIRHLFADEIAKRYAAIFDMTAATGFNGPQW